MPQIAVTESEPVAMAIVSNTSPGNCGHRVITYRLDGQTRTLEVHDSELSAGDGADVERAAVIAFIRLRRTRGKSEVGARII